MSGGNWLVERRDKIVFCGTGYQPVSFNQEHGLAAHAIKKIQEKPMSNLTSATRRDFLKATAAVTSAGSTGRTTHPPSRGIYFVQR